MSPSQAAVWKSRTVSLACLALAAVVNACGDGSEETDLQDPQSEESSAPVLRQSALSASRLKQMSDEDLFLGAFFGVGPAAPLLPRSAVPLVSRQQLDLHDLRKAFADAKALARFRAGLFGDLTGVHTYIESVLDWVRLRKCPFPPCICTRCDDALFRRLARDVVFRKEFASELLANVSQRT